MNKKLSRLKRAKRCRKHIQKLREVKLCVHRTPCHIYAQIISDDGARVLASAATVEKVFREQNKEKNNVEIASVIGEAIAERALKAGVKKVSFDRSGYKYHGRVKALADGARKGGLEF